MSRARLAATAIGVALVLAALLLDVARGQPFSFGALQALLALAGGTLAAVAGLGRRLPGAWRGLALLLLNTLVLAVLAEFGAGLALRRLPADRYAGAMPVAWYDSQPWIGDYRSEFPRVNDRYRFAAFLMWEGAPFAGRVISVDAEGRRTTPGARCGAGAWTLWLFGGSAMWGVGAPDSGTIAAFVQADLARRAARPVCVVNHGERAYVATQSLERLERELRRGRRPDAAVFYDGFNDANNALRYGRADRFQGADRVEQRLFRQSPLAAWLATWNLPRLARALRARGTPGDPLGTLAARGIGADSLARAVARSVHADHAMAGAIGAANGFVVLSFLQPMIAVGDKPLSPAERASLDEVTPEARAFFRETFAAMAAASAGGRFEDLSDAFAAEARPLYVDWVHVTPVGNAIVARRVADAVAAAPGFPAAATPAARR